VSKKKKEKKKRNRNINGIISFEEIPMNNDLSINIAENFVTSSQ
jgi:hypothetical protein